MRYGTIQVVELKDNVGELVKADADGKIIATGVLVSDLTGGSVVNMADISGNTITGVASGDALLWDGNDWVNDSDTLQNKVAVFTHEVTGNGGTATAGSWETRTLNTESVSASFASLGSNVITLSGGTYFIDGWTHGNDVNTFQSRVKKVGGEGTDVLYGSNGWSAAANDYGNQSILSGVLDVTGANATYEIQTQVQTTRSTLGYGRTLNAGVDNRYIQIAIYEI